MANFFKVVPRIVVWADDSNTQKTVWKIEADLPDLEYTTKREAEAVARNLNTVVEEALS